VHELNVVKVSLLGMCFSTFNI